MMALPHTQTQDHTATAEQAFILMLYNLHLDICSREEEIAKLKARSCELDRKVFQEERAVKKAEEWVRENEENLPRLERILLDEEKELDHCTGLLTTVIADIEELRPVGDEAFEKTQLLQATLQSLRWKLEHPEEVGEEEARTLVQSHEEERSSRGERKSQEEEPRSQEEEHAEEEGQRTRERQIQEEQRSQEEEQEITQGAVEKEDGAEKQAVEQEIQQGDALTDAAKNTEKKKKPKKKSK